MTNQPTTWAQLQRLKDAAAQANTAYDAARKAYKAQQKEAHREKQAA